MWMDKSGWDFWENAFLIYIFRRGAVDWDTAASSRSTGSRLLTFDKRISSKSSSWELWARYGLPTASSALPKRLPTASKPVESTFSRQKPSNPDEWFILCFVRSLSEVSPVCRNEMHGWFDGILLKAGLLLGGTACSTLLVQYGLVCFVFRRVREHHSVLRSSPLEETCVRQVVLDKWFPLNSAKTCLPHAGFRSAGNSATTRRPSGPGRSWLLV